MVDDSVPNRFTSVDVDIHDPQGKAAAVVRVSCVCGKLSRSMIGYGVSSEEAYRNAEAEATEFCSEFGGIQKLTRL